MRWRYDPAYFPPAPSVEIWLSAPGESFSVGPLRALIDTGADACVLPLRLIEPLGLQVDSEHYLSGYGGVRQRVDVYLMDIGIGNLRLPGIEVAADELGSDIIVGRNLLNKLVMTFDGPRQIVELPE